MKLNLLVGWQRVTMKERWIEKTVFLLCLSKRVLPHKKEAKQLPLQFFISTPSLFTAFPSTSTLALTLRRDSYSLHEQHHTSVITTFCFHSFKPNHYTLHLLHLHNRPTGKSLCHLSNHLLHHHNRPAVSISSYSSFDVKSPTTQQWFCSSTTYLLLLHGVVHTTVKHQTAPFMLHYREPISPFPHQHLQLLLSKTPRTTSIQLQIYNRSCCTGSEHHIRSTIIQTEPFISSLFITLSMIISNRLQPLNALAASVRKPPVSNNPTPSINRVNMSSSTNLVATS